MDLTEDSLEVKTARSKKMMLWFGIISMVMTFAGLTSAYVVSKNRPDWLNEFELPQSFLWSTIVILLSSGTLYLAKKSILQNKRKKSNSHVLAFSGGKYEP